MAADTTGNLAVLIDGDNVSYNIVVGLMDEIPKYGRASVRRIYGDFTSPSLKGWRKTLHDHSILPIQQFGYTTGKNSTDGAMIIDAMDLLYTGRFSAFCLVSSDSDFTRLAARIREQGVMVYGFGERKTNTAFIAACDKFVYFDVLRTPLYDPGPGPGPADTRAAPSETMDMVRPETHRDSPPHMYIPRTSVSKRPIDKYALEGIAKAVRSSIGYADNFANLAEVGLQLNRFSPDLHPRNYGYEKLREFVEASRIVRLKWINMGDKPPVVLVKLIASYADD